MTERVVRIKAMPKQLEFLRATERMILSSGAVGSGKSAVICMMSMMRAQIPGAVEGLCRKSLVALRATTLPTYIEGSGELGPIAQPGTYDWNKSDKTIRFHGGGMVRYFGVDDWQKIGSLNLTGLGIDEWPELSEKDTHMLLARVRVKVPDLPNQIYGACNPATPSHYLARMFGIKGPNAYEHVPGTKLITSTTYDNTVLGPGYGDFLTEKYGEGSIAHRRFVLGQWVGAEGLVYDTWDRSLHVRDLDTEPARVVLGVDDGYVNPFVVLRGELSGDDQLHIARECYHRTDDGQTGLSESEKVSRVLDLARGRGGGTEPTVVVDPSAPDLIGALRNSGLRVVPADNTVSDGIMGVQNRLRPRPDGVPGVTVSASCENTIREFESYEWDESAKLGLKDIPIKRNDHAMDALRYMVRFIDHRPGVVFEVVGEGGGVADNERREGESTRGYFQRRRDEDPDFGFDD